METMSDTPAADGDLSAADASRSMQMRLKLQANEHADQPVFSNFTTVQGAPGMVFVDFGFLEPGMLPGLAKIAQSGGKMPEQVNGRLACRVVLGVDAATQLVRQLEHQLRTLAPQAGTRSKPN
jgi:hypothetical protein